MTVERCPKCNKILSPQETRCSNCGAKLNNNTIRKINSIYHKSNVATLAYFIIFLISALIYAFVNWILAVIVGVVLFVVLVYFYYKN